MRVVVVGSGATGVHFALTALERGHAVTLVDVGYERPAPPAPAAAFDRLPAELDDPSAYFNGAAGDRVVFPHPAQKFYGFPPSKAYVFREPPGFRAVSEGIEPLFSFAQGGLAEAWTGGCYELNEHDLADFPVPLAELQPFYRTVARRIGVSAAEDDLARFSPFTAGYQPALATDAHSARLLAAYDHHRAALQRDLGFYLGRSRVAVLSQDLGDRRGCDYLGRCLWGCPGESLYGPSATLRDCRRHAGFTHAPGHLVSHFDYDAAGRVTALHAERVDGTGPARFEGDLYVLAAGTLCSSQIYLESIRRQTGEAPALDGLLDNRMVMVPFLSPGMIGRGVKLASYQFHQLAVGLETPKPEERVHGQVTTLKAASVHPIVQGLPLDLRTALRVFHGLRSGLGVANLWLHDRRRPECRVSLAPAGGRYVLRSTYVPDAGEPAAIADMLRRTAAGLRRLGAWVVPGMTKVLAKGASVHYAGTLPMLAAGGPHTQTPEGRSRAFPNLSIPDGAAFPFLPAKNLTFTLMANATRVATRLC